MNFKSKCFLFALIICSAQAWAVGFVAGTQILMENGEKLIQDVIPGENAVSINVDQEIRPTEPEIKNITKSDSFQSKTITFTLKNKKAITCAINQLFFVINYGWLEAHRLAAGMVIFGVIEDQEIASVTAPSAEEYITYSCEVPPFHSLVIEGLIAHNPGTIKVWLKCRNCGKNCTGANIEKLYKPKRLSPNKIVQVFDRYVCSLCTCTVENWWTLSLMEQRQRINMPEGVPPQGCDSVHQYIEYEDTQNTW